MHAWDPEFEEKRNKRKRRNRRIIRKRRRGRRRRRKKKEEKKEYTSLFHFHIVHLFFSLPAVLWRRKILKHVQKKHPTSSTPPSTESFDDKEYS